MNLIAFLEGHGITYRIYHHDKTYDAQHMAQSIHISGRKIAKTVMVRTSNGSDFIVLVVPATERVDLNRVAAILGGINVRMATKPEIRDHACGCELGIVPIFGSQYGMQTVVDETLTHQDELVFQGETHADTIRMRFADFYLLEHPRIATIVKQDEGSTIAS
jgi:Ala-tRNA(Pro) deacylase